MHSNGCEYVLRSGDVVFIHKGATHDFNSDPLSGMKSIEVKFRCDDENLLSGVPVLFQDSDSQIFNLIQRIVSEGQRKRSGYRLMSDSLLMECLITMIRLTTDGSSAADPNDPVSGQTETRSPLRSAVDDYIYNNLSDNISLQELAAGCGYNQDYIYRVIHRETGLSTLQYINRIRFDEACRLILHSELSISEIAWNLGFGSIQYFSRFFRKYAGISPSEYLDEKRGIVKTRYI